MKTDRRPEQTFFPDPALDRAFAVVMALAAELWVVKDRMRALETRLAEKGVLDLAELDREPEAAEAAALAAERDAFTAHLMEPLLGRQQSKGAP